MSKGLTITMRMLAFYRHALTYEPDKADLAAIASDLRIGQRSVRSVLEGLQPLTEPWGQLEALLRSPCTAAGTSADPWQSERTTAPHVIPVDNRKDFSEAQWAVSRVLELPISHREPDRSMLLIRHVADAACSRDRLKLEALSELISEGISHSADELLMQGAAYPDAEVSRTRRLSWLVNEPRGRQRDPNATQGRAGRGALSLVRSMLLALCASKPWLERIRHELAILRSIAQMTDSSPFRESASDVGQLVKNRLARLVTALARELEAPPDSISAALSAVAATAAIPAVDLQRLLMSDCDDAHQRSCLDGIPIAQLSVAWGVLADLALEHLPHQQEERYPKRGLFTKDLTRFQEAEGERKVSERGELCTTWARAHHQMAKDGPSTVGLAYGANRLKGDGAARPDERRSPAPLVGPSLSAVARSYRVGSLVNEPEVHVRVLRALACDGGEFTLEACRSLQHAISVARKERHELEFGFRP